MDKNGTPRDLLFLGIDGGGSKCRAKIITDQGEVLGTGIAGPANLSSGIARATESILSAALFAMENSGLDDSMISELISGVGLAGVNLPGHYRAIRQWQHPFQKMFATTDLHIACIGAHKGQDGAVIIVGTGSSGIACVKGNNILLGGHGFPIGDKGSGAWIGLKCVQQVLLSLDRIVSNTILTELLFSRFNCKDALSLVEKIVPVSPSEFAKLAPLVFEAVNRGDYTATKIVKEAGEYITSIARKLLLSNPPRISLIGGLSVLITPWLEEDIVDRLSPPIDQPEAGAIYYAQMEFMQLNDICE